jgi:hypothetical protein
MSQVFIIAARRTYERDPAGLAGRPVTRLGGGPSCHESR